MFTVEKETVVATNVGKIVKLEKLHMSQKWGPDSLELECEVQYYFIGCEVLPSLHLS